MGYKIFEENNEFYFKYAPTKQKIRKNINKINETNNPFNILKNINFK